ncbi:hypothetical protein [Aminobacter sp. UC22_36]|uniref:hypothetical protein n=1 Tax=Aminobacter sp. UC22_36 TaxID=3374549 RepID=UPI0037568080
MIDNYNQLNAGPGKKRQKGAGPSIAVMQIRNSFIDFLPFDATCDPMPSGVLRSDCQVDTFIEPMRSRVRRSCLQ